MLTDAIFTLLKSDATLLAFMTGEARIYPDSLPEGIAYPAISFFEVSELRDHSMSGPTNLARPRIQFDVWSKDKHEMRAISNRIRQVLDGFHGVIAGTSYDGETPFSSTVQGIFLENRHSLYEPITKTRHGVLDFFVWNDERLEL